MKSMRIGGGGKVIFGMAFGLALYMVWYAVAVDYEYGALAGTYVLAANGTQCTLKLAPDHTFAEEIDNSSEVSDEEQNAAGESSRTV